MTFAGKHCLDLGADHRRLQMGRLQWKWVVLLKMDQEKCCSHAGKLPHNKHGLRTGKYLRTRFGPCPDQIPAFSKRQLELIFVPVSARLLHEVLFGVATQIRCKCRIAFGFAANSQLNLQSNSYTAQRSLLQPEKKIRRDMTTKNMWAQGISRTSHWESLWASRWQCSSPAGVTWQQTSILSFRNWTFSGSVSVCFSLSVEAESHHSCVIDTKIQIFHPLLFRFWHIIIYGNRWEQIVVITVWPEIHSNW